MKIKALVAQAFVFFFLIKGIHALSSEGNSFIQYKEPFVQISDPHRQAEVWATCHVAYEVFSRLAAKAEPAQSQQFHQFANGAKVAIIMTYIRDAMGDMDPKTPEASTNRFNAAIEFGKLAAESLPETKATSLMAILESGNESQKTKWYADIGATINHCVGNLEGQQVLIDLWRDLATSGLLKQTK